MSIPKARQRLGWALAQEANAHEALTKAFDHVRLAVSELADPPEPEPVPPPATSKLDLLFDDDRSVALPPFYLDLFNHWAPIHWDRQLAQVANPTGDGPFALTYYDRGFGFIGMARNGADAIWQERGLETVRIYRDDYVLPNDGGVPPRWCLPEGLAAHHLLTGDTESLRAVELISGRMRHWIDGGEDILTTNYRDGRIQGRAILAQQIAYLLTGDQQYADAAQLGIDKLIVWYDVNGDGRWDSGALPGSPSGANSYCDGMATFQVCHAILDCLVSHQRIVAPVPRLAEILEKTLDRTWNYWTPDGFRYIQPPVGAGSPFDCPGSGTDSPSKDVSLLCSTAFRYGHEVTGLPRFAGMADVVEAHGLGGTGESPTIYMNGNKQFNQSFFRAWRRI